MKINRFFPGLLTTLIALILCFSVSINALAASPTPKAPTASEITANSVKLSWTLWAGSFNLYRDNVCIYQSFSYSGVSTYIDKGLSPGTAYSYTLRYCGNGDKDYLSDPSPVCKVTTLLAIPATPAAPTESGITANSVALSWTAVPAATTYYLLRNGVQIYSGPNITYSDTGLSPDSTYSYTLKAGNSLGSSAASPACSVQTMVATPAAPTASNITNSSVTLNWTAVAGATTYYLFRNGVQVYSGSNTSYVDTALSSNTTYSYTLKAGNAVGISPDSPARIVTTLIATPAVPTASNITSSSATLNWSAVSGATLYYLYRDGAQVYSGSNRSYTDTKLSSGKTYSYTLRAYNTNGYSLYSPARSVTTPSTDAKLKSLNIYPGILKENFDPDRLNYTSSVSYAVSGISISAETRDQKANIEGIGEKNLELGANIIYIKVTAEDCITTETYEITITCLSTDAKLKNLSMSTGDGIVQFDLLFDPDEASYTAVVPYEVSNIEILAEANHPKAEFTGAGIKSLGVGANPFTVEVTAEDGTTKSYTVTINRAPPSTDASLSNLSISPGILDPDFQADITSYTVSVPYDIEEMTIAAQSNHSAATIDGDGQQYLEVGDNLFKITVTAQDKTTKTYTIVVTREPQPQLINLILSAGELDSDFDPDITNYIVSVPGEINTISITALVGGSGINIGFSQGGAHQIGNQWFSDSLNLDTAEKMITVYVYKDGLLQASYNITIMRDHPPVPIYRWEATGDIGTVGRVLFEIPGDFDFLEKYALVCDEDLDVEIYYSPKRTENAIAAGQNTYVFAVRLPNGETDEDISFSFKPIGGAVEKNKIIIYGDVNEDGFITTTDATLVTRWAGGNTSAVIKNILAADVNGDAYITTTDATLITRRAGGNTATAFKIEAEF